MDIERDADASTEDKYLETEKDRFKRNSYRVSIGLIHLVIVVCFLLSHIPLFVGNWATGHLAGWLQKKNERERFNVVQERTGNLWRECQVTNLYMVTSSNRDHASGIIDPQGCSSIVFDTTNSWVVVMQVLVLVSSVLDVLHIVALIAFCTIHSRAPAPGAYSYVAVFCRIIYLILFSTVCADNRLAHIRISKSEQNGISKEDIYLVMTRAADIDYHWGPGVIVLSIILYVTVVTMLMLIFFWKAHPDGILRYIKRPISETSEQDDSQSDSSYDSTGDEQNEIYFHTADKAETAPQPVKLSLCQQITQLICCSGGRTVSQPQRKDLDTYPLSFLQHRWETTPSQMVIQSEGSDGKPMVLRLVKASEQEDEFCSDEEDGDDEDSVTTEQGFKNARNGKKAIYRSSSGTHLWTVLKMGEKWKSEVQSKKSQQTRRTLKKRKKRKTVKFAADV
ncbi:uncharacterized protein LOC101850170 [Aplysia californica]|uniref:Uncharacterized protein LOC101850170 n=1 Tax=Aplysia californica TaxID=6500 RepID=A0ABM1VTK4_APLCA|nr:uncharacterized protein LOC101850170 [Aplysia californica]